MKNGIPLQFHKLNAYIHSKKYWIDINTLSYISAQTRFGVNLFYYYGKENDTKKIIKKIEINARPRRNNRENIFVLCYLTNE